LSPPHSTLITLFSLDCIANVYISLNFNIVCKRLGAQRMSHFLNEAATELRDLLMPDLVAQPEKPKL
jgi:hypothetical protein